MRGSPIAQTIATVPGFHWFLVDAEHGQIGDGDYYEVSLRARISKTSPGNAYN